MYRQCPTFLKKFIAVIFVWKSNQFCLNFPPSLPPPLRVSLPTARPKWSPPLRSLTNRQHPHSLVYLWILLHFWQTVFHNVPPFCIPASHFVIFIKEKKKKNRRTTFSNIYCSHNLQTVTTEQMAFQSFPIFVVFVPFLFVFGASTERI